MYGTESFNFWWLIPVLMILFCLLMCLSMRRRGTAGCCMGWRGPREVSRDRRGDYRDDSHRTIHTSMPAAEGTQTEAVRSTIESLEHRLRSLEEMAKAKELKKDPPSNGS